MKSPIPLSLVLAIIVPLGGGVLGGLLTTKEIKGWYRKLKKPKWTPPNWLFGPAWSALYTCIGVASWLTWKNAGRGKAVLPLTLYGIQLALNFAWTPLFFGAHRPDLAMIDITGNLGTATAATVLMTQASQSKEVAMLMVPYLSWLSFAAALNYRIWKDNPQADKIGRATAETDETAEAAKQIAAEAVRKAQ